MQSSDEIIRFFVTFQERGDLRVLHFDLVAVERETGISADVLRTLLFEKFGSVQMNVARSNTATGDLAQVAALPLIIGDDGIVRVLLLTSRETKRWVRRAGP